MEFFYDEFGKINADYKEYITTDKSTGADGMITSGWGNHDHSHGLQPSPWRGERINALTTEQLEELLEQMKSRKKKDQFDIEELTEDEMKELKKEVKAIISKKG